MVFTQPIDPNDALTRLQARKAHLGAQLARYRRPRKLPYSQVRKLDPTSALDRAYAALIAEDRGNDFELAYECFARGYRAGARQPKGKRKAAVTAEITMLRERMQHALDDLAEFNDPGMAERVLREALGRRL